jgi:D-alanine-D-alanine ligase-like ATP-grasp enzyme
MDSKQKKNIIKVGILRGGIGDNFLSSLQKGGDIISHISKSLADKYKVLDILIDKEGIWHLNGIPIVPADLMRKVDVIWNNIGHPKVSTILSDLSIPSIGGEYFSGVLENNKDMLRKHLKTIGVGMPRSVVLPSYQKDFDGPIDKYATRKAKEVFEKFSSPWIVKSFTEDKNMGIHLAKTFPELIDAITDGVNHGKSILVEEFIAGKVASVHSIPKYRGEDIYVFPIGNSFGVFSNDEKEKLAIFVKTLYQHLNIDHYLKSDLILDKKGKIHVLNIELKPDFKDNSHFQQVCDSVGAKTHHIIKHFLDRARSPI